MDTSNNLVPIGSTGKLENNIALPYQFSIGSVIQESWKRVRGTKATYFGAIVLYILIYLALISLGMLVTYFFLGSLNPDDPAVKLFSAGTRLIISLLLFPIPCGICLLSVYRSVNLPVKFKQIFNAYHFYWKLLGVFVILYVLLFLITIVTALVTTFLIVLISHYTNSWLIHVPLLLAVIGGLFGIYVLFSLSNALILVIEKRLGVFQALKTSFLAFNQHGFKIIGTNICLILIYILGIIPLGIGLIWTFPWMLNGMGILYRIQFGVEKNVD